MTIQSPAESTSAWCAERFAVHLFAGAVLVLASGTGCTNPVGEHHPEWKNYFDQVGASGCIEFYDLKESRFIDYNPDRCAQRFIPASTFKIPNALIALESKAIPDTGFVIVWDSTDRGNPLWNRNQSMAEAFRNSTVWYFQEVARRIGRDSYSQYLNLLHYGNKNPGGAADSFWLNGDLRISADEQVAFLTGLRTYNLRLSRETIDRVRGMMLLEKTATYSLYGKTGWAQTGSGNLGWFVGWIEKGNRAWFFALNMETGDPPHAAFASARKEIVMQCMKDLKILP